MAAGSRARWQACSYALVYYRRGRIGEAVAAHAIANALIAFWVLTRGDWSLWC